MTESPERNFDKEVLGYDMPVFTCFTTEWCQSCYATCLFADQLAKEYDSRVKLM